MVNYMLMTLVFACRGKSNSIGLNEHTIASAYPPPVSFYLIMVLWITA